MTRHLTFDIRRRDLLRFGSATALAAGFAGAADARDARIAPEGDAFRFEVSRSEAEWRALLSDEEFVILRGGSTELPRTSPLWDNTAAGTYHCRGCDLALYYSEWKQEMPAGWLFFRHSIPHATLTELDAPPPEYGLPADGPDNMIEVVCRRCGSHLGHIVRAGTDPLHCIDGTSLTFQPVAA